MDRTSKMYKNMIKQINQTVTISSVSFVIRVILTLKKTLKNRPKNTTITNYSICRNFQLSDIIRHIKNNYGNYGKLRQAVTFLHRLSAKLRESLYILLRNIYIPFCRMCPTVTEGGTKNGIQDAYQSLPRLRCCFEGIYGGRI